MVLSPQYAGWRKGGIFRNPETEVGLRGDHFGMHRMTGRMTRPSSFTSATGTGFDS
jgi:hypothetical protein